MRKLIPHTDSYYTYQNYYMTLIRQAIKSRSKNRSERSDNDIKTTIGRGAEKFDKIRASIHEGVNARKIRRYYTSPAHTYTKRHIRNKTLYIEKCFENLNI